MKGLQNNILKIKGPELAPHSIPHNISMSCKLKLRCFK